MAQRELSHLQAAYDELGRNLRVSASELAELRGTSAGFALKSVLQTMQTSTEAKLGNLEEKMGSLDRQMGGLNGAMAEGRFGQRQSLIENRQMGLERTLKNFEQLLGQLQEELTQRPLKTDIISAIATQEMAVEACASNARVTELEEQLKSCAARDALLVVQEAVSTLREQQQQASTTVADLRETAATKAALAQRGREVEQLRGKVEEKISRDECATMLSAKFDRAEAVSIMQGHEQLQAAVVNNEAQTKRLHDAVSNSSAHALDASGSVRQLQTRTERLQLLAQELDGRISARKAELGSIVKVVRLLLEDAEMRCAIDEAEGSMVADASEGRGRGRAAPPRGIPPLNVNGMTIHKQVGGSQLTPIPPGTDNKIWYKSSLTPRPELLGHRKRLLVSARHSWVGDQCLARTEDAPAMSPRDINECRQVQHAAALVDEGSPLRHDEYHYGMTPGSTGIRETTG